MKSSKYFKFAAYILIIFCTIYFSFFKPSDDRIYGNIITRQVLSNFNYHITSGVNGIPFHFGILSSLTANWFLRSMPFLLTIFLVFLGICLLLQKKYFIAALIPLIFPILSFFGYENLNFISYLLFLILLYLIKKNLFPIGQMAFSLLLVNTNPLLFLPLILIFIFEKKRWYFFLFTIPLNIFYLLIQKMYYIPSLSQFMNYSPFILFYIILLSLLSILAIEKSRKNYILLSAFILLSIFEPPLFPFMILFVISKSKKSKISKWSSIVTFFLILIFFRGVPLGNDVTIAKGNHILKVYSEFKELPRMPHFGKIFNYIENGYLIDTVFYPNIASTRAFFAKHNKKYTLNSFLKRDAKNIKKDDIGVVIIPVKEIYNDGSLLYKLLKTNNWLLTYIDGGFMVLDWDPNLHIVKYYEPYYLQKLLRNESVSDHQKESLWYYADKCYEDYRDIDSANLSLFIAYKLKDQYRIDSVEKRFSVLKKNKDTNYILALNGKISITKFIKKYPYDSRGWYLAYKQTHKKIFLSIAKLLKRRDEKRLKSLKIQRFKVKR